MEQHGRLPRGTEWPGRGTALTFYLLTGAELTQGSRALPAAVPAERTLSLGGINLFCSFGGFPGEGVFPLE